MPYGVIIDVTYNQKSADKNLKSLLKKISKANKVDLVVDTEKFKKITKEYEKLRAKIEKQPLKVDLDAKAFKRANTEIIKEIEKTSKQRNDLGKIEQSRIKRIQESEKQSAKETNRAFLEGYKKREDALKRLSKLGQEVGSVSGLNFGNESEIKQQLQSVYGLDSVVTRYQETVDSAGKKIIKYAVATQDADNKQRIFKGTVDSVSGTIRQSSTDIKTVNSNLTNMSSRLLGTIKQSLVFASTIGLMQRALGKLREGFDFIVDAENQFTQIRAITGKTKEETDALLVSYNKLGQELGITTKELNSIALSLFRQGLNAKEVENRMINISKVSKVTGADIRLVTDSITAGINGAGLSAERFGDVLTLAGSISATSFEEVSASVNKVIGVSKEAGVDFELLVSQVATLSSTLRGLSGETIGNSLKTIFARFSKVSSETGELNEDLNKVQTAIESVGIAFVDSSGQIRPVGDLLKELSGVWGDLDKNTKNYLSTQIAGVRQISVFQTLMQNFNKTLDINNQLLESSGTVAKQYEAVQDSLGSTLNRLTGAFEDLFLSTLNSDSLKNLIDFATVIVKIVDKIGVLNIAVTALSFVMLTSNKNFIAFTTSLVTSQGLIGGFITVMNTLGATFTRLITGQITLRGAFTALGISMDITRVKAVLLQATLSLGLAFAIQGVITLLSAWARTSSELKQKNKELDDSIDQQVAKYDKLTEAQQRNTKARLLALKTEAEAELPALEEQRKKLQEKIDELEGRLQSGDTTENRYVGKGIYIDVDATQEIAKELKNLTTEQTELNSEIDKYSGYVRDYNSVTKEQVKQVEEVATAQRKEYEQITNLKGEYDGLINSLDDLVEKEKEYSDQLSTSTTKISDYNGIIQELDKEHKLSAETIDDIIQKYPELTSAVEDGTFNELELRKLISEGLEKEKEDYKNATLGKLAISDEFYKNILLKESTLVSELSTKYGVDLKNFTNLEKAKTSILSKFASRRNQIIAKNLAGATSLEISTALSAISQQDVKLRAELDAFNADIDALVSQYSPTGIDFSTLGITEEKSSTKTQKEKTYETDIKQQSIIEARIKDINSALEEQLKIVSDIDTEAKNLTDSNEDQIKKVELLNKKREEELKLAEQIKNARSELISAQNPIIGQISGLLGVDATALTEEELSSELNKQFSGERTFDSESDKEAFTAKYEEVNRLISERNKLQSEINTKNKDLANSDQSILEINQDILDIQYKLRENIKKIAKEKLEEALLQGNTISGLEAENKELQNAIDSMKKINSLKKEEEDRAKRLKAIEEARIKLQNAQTQKTVRLFTGEKFEFVADPRAVQQAQDDLNKLTEDNAQKEKEIERQRVIASLQAKINENNNLIKATKEAYKEIERNLETYLNTEGVLFTNQGIETNKIVADTLIELEKTYGIGLESISKAITPKISTLNSQLMSLQSLSAQIGDFASGAPTLNPTVPVMTGTSGNTSNSTTNNNSININGHNGNSNELAQTIIDRMAQFSSR